MGRRKQAVLRATRRFASQFRTPQFVWIISDLLIAVPAFLLAVLIRFGGDLSQAELSVGIIAPRAILFASLIVAGLFATGMYRTRHRVLPIQVLSHTTVSVAIGGLLNILIFYVYPPVTTGRGVLAAALLIALLAIYLARRLLAPFYEGIIRRRRVIVIGAGRAAQKIGMRRRRADHRQYEIVGYLETLGDLPVDGGIPLEPRIIDSDDLYDIDFDEAVLALDDRRGAIFVETLFNFRQRGVDVITLVDFLEREAGRVDIDVTDADWFVFTLGCHSRPGYLVAKRAIDIVSSIVITVVSSPVLLLVAIALFAEGKGNAPILYRQQRVGLRGKPFELLKFRSMRVDAELEGAKWSTQGDTRITLVGRVIRRMRLDELPQLINVLKGEMSIVGPRPERPEFLLDLTEQIPMYEYRHLVKPGLAGWAQLSFPYGASVSDAREKFKYDLYYIKYARCMMDFFILAQTLEIVIWGEGVSMSGRSNHPDADLPSARLPIWRPRTHETSDKTPV
jgi:sugar transferase (PEP-CTERM system associated)